MLRLAYLISLLSLTLCDEFVISDSSYGKTGVKLLHVSKAGSVFTIKEVEVLSLLTLNSTKDYETGDNSDIIATDSQKNTVYILAKQHGISSPEEFGLLVSDHFLSSYPWVTKSRVEVRLHPWQRIVDSLGRKHSHAFVSVPDMVRTAEVIRERGSMPEVSAGIRDLRVLKTTQSSFVDFVDDEYRALPFMEDRLLSTVVTGDWSYSSPLGGQQQYDDAFNKVRDTILEVFAGPADTGIFSASVQNSQHLTQTRILETIPTIKSVTLAYPNVHYFGFDFSRFSEIPGLIGDGSGSGEVFKPVDKPSGLIKSTLSRQQSPAPQSWNEPSAWSALPMTKHGMELAAHAAAEAAVRAQQGRV